jgi:hypothetical protein
MSEFKGTKGKWSTNKLSILDENRRVISQCYLMTFEHDKRGIQIPDTIGYFNALLISKAPEMLQDLIDIVWLIDMGATTEELHKRIEKSKQLIKEATEL